MNDVLLSVQDLHVRFQTYAGVVHAVNGLSFEMHHGEIFGLVGESGCGKSVTGLAILRMVPHPGEIVQGRVTFEGEDLLRPERDSDSLLVGNLVGFVIAVGVQGLRAAQDGCEPLQGHSDDVDLGLLRGERDPCGLCMESEPP